MRGIEDFLGGKPQPKDVHVNKHGDITIIKGNKKFRMDVKRPGDKIGPDGKKTPEDPHFHLYERRNGEWEDVTKQHRHFFKKDGVKK
jgi:hypothetical protein